MLQALAISKEDVTRREKAAQGENGAAGVEQEKPAMVNAVAAGRGMGACFHCGKMGHKAFDCYDNPRSRNYKGKGAPGMGWNGVQQSGEGGSRGDSRQQRGKFFGACHHCKKIGHRAIDCYSNPNSRSYRGTQQQGSAPAKAHAAEAEKREADVILGGAHKANVARASGVCLMAKGGGEAAWYMDSGCTQHMTDHSEWLNALRASSVPYVLVGDDRKLLVKGEGDLILQGQYGELKLENVLLVDGLSLNLISQSQLDNTGCKTFSNKGSVWMFDHAWNVVAKGMLKNGLYEMLLNEKGMTAEKVTYQQPTEEGVLAREELRASLKSVPVEELRKEAVSMVAAAAKVDMETLHRRLGHAGMERIKELVQKEMTVGVELKDGDGSKGKCDKCVEGKITKSPHPKHQVQEPYGALEIVAADVCGPLRVASRHGSKYFVTFTDLGTRHTWVTELKDKTEVFSSFLDWMVEAERQSGKQLKVLRTDNGGEFVNEEFNSYLRSKGILRQLTVPYTPQHNSIAERVNRSLLDCVRTLLADSGLPLKFWGDALGMACWVKNRLPTKGLAADMTPHEAFYGRKPNMGLARVWGCMVQYREPAGPTHKLLPRSKWGLNLGMCMVSKGWVIKDVEIGKVVVTRDVIFYENVTYLKWKGVSSEIATAGEAANLEKVEGLLEETSIEGIGDEVEEIAEEEAHTWVWELPERMAAQGRKEMEQQEIEPEEKDATTEVEMAPRESEQGSTARDGHDPWKLLDSTDSREAEKEIEELLEDGATAIGVLGQDEQEAAEKENSEVESPAEELGRGKREKKRNPKYVHLLMTPWKNVHTHLLLTISATALVSRARREAYGLPNEPLTVEEALTGPQKEQWRAAIQEELDTLAERGTWELMPMPEGRSAVGVKWVFKIKTGDKGQLERFKARLVAKGYTQVEGIDYTDTYAPVSKLTTARAFLKVIAARNYFLVQLDIKNAFLHGVVKEELYMEQPPGFEDGTNKKCKLIKALYGLKQSPREWNKVMDERLLKGGFHKSECDRAFYWRGAGKEKVYLLLYVDDILVAGALPGEVEKVCEHLAEVFQVKQIPRTTLFLGMNLERNREERKLFLYQQKYCKRVEQKFGHGYAKAITTPLSGMAESDNESEEDVLKWDGQERALQMYQSMVGQVMYPVSCTKVDMAYAASYLGQHAQQGRKWREMRRTIDYLLQHQDEGLLFEGGEETLELVGYADASHASCKETRRGAYGYVFLLGGTAITWQAKKLADIALSSAEAEYMALFFACQEGVWLRRLLNEFEIDVKGPTVVRTDSKSAMDLAKNDNWHGRTKHMDVKYHWVREQLEKQQFKFEFVRTEEQAADFLTKVLPRANFEYCKEKVGIRTLKDMQGSVKVT
ncbi:hypothetical protein CLOP_g11416 [Closterium sp. NIES-67]|nr:hypothetical protein CLOP_g11416 [Closterium sp. NIES-67]